MGVISRFAPVLRAVFAQASGLVVGLALLTGSQASAQVVINEVMASNASAVQNEGIFPDWVELFNTSTSPVNLTDWSISDSQVTPRKFVFPAGTVIPARGYLIVWCDDLIAAPGLHTGFSFSDKADDVSLYNSVAAGSLQQDTVAFGLQITDLTVGRVPDGAPNTFTLTRPTPLAANQAVPLGLQDTLKINEIMADPTSGDDWFEMYNPATNHVQFGGLVWSDRTNSPSTNRAIPGLSFIAPGGFVQFFADNLQNRDADQTDFRLSAGGEAVVLFRTNRVNIIDSIAFGAQTAGASYGRLPDGGTNLVTFAPGRSTPAASNFQLLTEIVFNELLTHTDPPLEDAIELYNPTASPVDISHFWLSNSKDEPKKFRIPPGTVIPAGGYKVFYEWPGSTNGFNPAGNDNSPSFTLNSSQGDEVYLNSADAAGNLTFFQLSRSFGPTENGVSLGRYVTSEGKTDFVPMSRRTFGVDNPATLVQFRMGTGMANAYPKIGPLVINEIHYHPPDAEPGTDNTLDEYIELYNVSPATVPLYDPVIYPFADGRTNTWRLRGEVDFDFPQNINVPRGGYVVLVNFDPAANPAQLAAFRSRFAVPAEAQIFGPYQGNLSNSGGNVELYKPDPPQAPGRPDAGLVPYIYVDRIQYKDALPWPDADGTGAALERTSPEEYGNDPINWTATAPSPGKQNIRIQSIGRAGNVNTIRFRAIANTSYTLQRASVAGATAGTGTNVWATAGTSAAQTNSGTRTISDTTADPRRFYRITTP